MKIQLPQNVDHLSTNNCKFQSMQHDNKRILLGITFDWFTVREIITIWSWNILFVFWEDEVTLIGFSENTPLSLTGLIERFTRSFYGYLMANKEYTKLWIMINSSSTRTDR